MKAFLLSDYASDYALESVNPYAIILEQTMERVIISLKAEIVQFPPFKNPTVCITMSQEAVLSLGIPVLTAALMADWDTSSECLFALREVPLITSYPLP